MSTVIGVIAWLVGGALLAVLIGIPALIVGGVFKHLSRRH